MDWFKGDVVNRYVAHVKAAYSRCEFVDTGVTEGMFQANVVISAQSEEDLRRLSFGVYMGQRIDFDWVRMLAIHNDHSDPLYLWREDGRVFFEFEVYFVDRPIILDWMYLGVHGASPHRVSVSNVFGDFSDFSFLFSSYEFFADKVCVSFESKYPVTIVVQTYIETFSEKVYEQSLSGFIVIPIHGLGYLGCSVSSACDNGSEVEHKYVFRGRLPHLL